LDIRIEAAIAVQEPNDIENVSRLGKLSPFTCPECHGALWEIEDGPMLRYRCHVGHAFSAEDAQAAQNREIQRMLESVVRANRERAALVRRMAEKERKGQNAVLAERLERRAVEYDENARVLGSLLAAADEAAVTNLTSRSNLAANGEEDGETT
jgi:two-component system chemotaxis response regulator CheB